MERPFSYAPVASPIHDEAAVQRILSGLGGALAMAGGAQRGVDAAPADQPLLHVVLTGGTEREVLDRVARRAASAGREPVVLVAHPGHNSLPACLEILARVRADGGVGRILQLEKIGSDVARLKEAAHLVGVANSLRRARIGAIGAPSDWLVASAHAPEKVHDAWGPTVVPIAMHELDRQLDTALPDARLAQELIAQAGTSEVAEGEVLGASEIYRALEALVAEHRLWALSLRCFDLVQTRRTTGCLALSRLCDDGVPAGCEGDVPSIVAMLWMHLLTGDVPWMANPARISPSAGEIVLAHCTVPRSMVRGYDVRTHFESGLGVALAGQIAPGPVTLLRLGGPALEKLWVAEGELAIAPRDEALCRTQALVRTDEWELETLLEEPLGNHIVLVPGRRSTLLSASRELVLGV